MNVLDEVKTLIGLSDDESDNQLISIIDITQKRLAALLGVSTVPESLGYIVTEVSVRRFNRIGSEGLTSHTVEGESLTFNENDFASFHDDIEQWKADQESRKRKVIRFL